MIPQDFESWKICIEKQCMIPLTVQFAKARLAVYSQKELPETRRFIARYGEGHHQRILRWFGQIANQLHSHS